MEPRRSVAPAALLFLLVLPSLVWAEDLEVHFIDVGQGDCTYISCPNGNKILVDCGTSKDGDGDAVRQYLLTEMGTPNVDIDTLVVTHPDQDHYNLLPTVVGNGTVGQVFKIGSKSAYKIEPARDWLYGHKEKFITKNAGFFDPPGFPNEDIDCGDAEVYILASNVKAKGGNANKDNHKVNAKSIVLMIVYGDLEGYCIQNLAEEFLELLLLFLSPDPVALLLLPTACPFLDTLLETSVHGLEFTLRSLEPVDHRVERGCQLTQLVLRGDDRAAAQITCRDALGGVEDREQRPRDHARDQDQREHADQEYRQVI